MTGEVEAANSVEFTRATPVLMCSDYEASRAFYVGLLGFTVLEEGGNPPRFAILKRGGSMLFINAWHGARPPAPEAWDAYFHIRGLERLHADYRAAGVPISRAPHTTVYGMREFEVTDPDGNLLCFGEDAAE